MRLGAVFKVLLAEDGLLCGEDFIDRHVLCRCIRAGREQRQLNVAFLRPGSGGPCCQPLSDEGGDDVFDLSSFMDGVELELLNEIAGKIEGGFHEASKPASQQTVNFWSVMQGGQAGKGGKATVNRIGT